jgi:tRNA (guanine37-N1)-methyltransferase
MVECIVIDKVFAEHVLDILKKHGLISNEYRTYRVGDQVFIPLKDHVNYEYLKSIIGNISFKIMSCNPPKRRRKHVENVPSHDLLGKVVIIRANVLERYSINELVNIIRSIYPGVKAIYLKEETVEEFRIPRLKLLWGTSVEEVIVKEYGLLFKVLLGKVYYNRRLSEEHHRLALICGDNEKIIDLFSGIGGFAIHIASKHKSIVLANDLNPYAHKLIIENILLNRKRIRGLILATRLNASEFMGFNSLRNYFDRIIANLPHRSIEYMDLYDHLLTRHGYLHLYIVAKNIEEVISLINEKYGNTWFIDSYKGILDYAPYTYIYRIDLVKR